MTDTFANGPSTPGGTTPDAAPQAGDVTGTLAELERKLRELEGELNSIGRRRELAGATPQPDSAEASPSSPGGRLVDEALEPPTPVAPVTSITPPVAAPAPVAPPAPTVPPQAPIAPAAVGSMPASAPAAAPAGSGQPVKFMRPPESARPRASREPAGQSQPDGESEPPWESARQERPRPSEAQLASLAELRRFRDRLERFARDLAAEYDALLGRVMSGLTSAPAATGAATPTEATPGPPLSSVPAAASSTHAGDVPPAIAQPTASGATGPVPAAAPESPEDVLFEGRVELGVGPFYDIASLSAFERGLASLPYVVEASVRRFEASHAVVDVRLAAPVALVRELRRTVESGFSVREVADGRVLLTFDEA